jgi:hypothetical protein
MSDIETSEDCWPKSSLAQRKDAERNMMTAHLMLNGWEALYFYRNLTVWGMYNPDTKELVQENANTKHPIRRADLLVLKGALSHTGRKMEWPDMPLLSLARLWRYATTGDPRPHDIGERYEPVKRR